MRSARRHPSADCGKAAGPCVLTPGPPDGFWQRTPSPTQPSMQRIRIEGQTLSVFAFRGLNQPLHPKNHRRPPAIIPAPGAEVRGPSRDNPLVGVSRGDTCVSPAFAPPRPFILEHPTKPHGSPRGHASNISRHRSGSMPPLTRLMLLLGWGRVSLSRGSGTTQFSSRDSSKARFLKAAPWQGS